MSCEPADIELKQLIDRWIAQWNEPRPDGVPAPSVEIRGHDALYARIIAGSGLDVLTFGPGGVVGTDHQFVA